MSQVKVAAIAVGGSLALASIVVVPTAFATVPGSPFVKPTVTQSVTKSETKTKTKVKLTTTEAPCKPEDGIDADQAKKVTPWAQQRLNFSEVWRLTQGQGVSVAVVDSGVDDSNPQLRGAVSRRADVTKTRYRNRDCLGHGTSVAGIIAARDVRSESGIPFIGVAPQSRIIAAKFTNESNDKGGHLRLPSAIRRAVDLGAQVINVSVEQNRTRDLESAVKYAQSKDRLVVASSGNVEDKDQRPVPAYPAQIDGVLSVGSVDESGKLSDTSNAVTNVSVVAPGKAIMTTWAGGSWNPGFDGTSAATPFVAGTAALVRAYHPNLDYKQVIKRIEKTADGSTVHGTGKGQINPLRAVTAVIPGEKAGATKSRAFTPQPVSVTKADPDDRFSRVLGLSLAAGALGVAGIVAAGGIIIPAGRRRGWKAGGGPPRDPSA